MGEVFALAAALSWAVSAFLFRAAGTQIPPLLLNASKGILAVAALFAWIALTGSAALARVTTNQWWWLLGSGAIGIGIGDTAFFSALNRLGERTTVLVAETLAPPLTAVLAFWWMHEVLSPTAWVGICITMLGVTWVLTERKRSRDEPSISAALKWNDLFIPACLAVVAAACQSCGAVISRSILVESGMGPAESSLIRMLGGLAILAAVIPVVPKSKTAKVRWTRKTIAYALLATLLGTIVGIVCQQASLKYTSAGISQTLIATSVLFVLPISLLRGERPTRRSIIGTLLGLVGVAILCSR